MPDDHSRLVPLLPIPNRTVKRFCADDSAVTSVKVGYCQAMFMKKAPVKRWGLFFCFVFREGRLFGGMRVGVCCGVLQVG